MAGKKRKAELIIAGDNKGGVKALRDTGNAADGLSGKLGGIGKAATVGFAALGAAAVGGGALLFKVGEEFDQAYDKIRAGTGATGDALTGLQDDFRSVLATVPADADAASTAIADINTRLGLTGDALQDRSEQLLNLSRITGTDVSTNIEAAADVLNNFGVAAGDQEQTLDRMFRVSQATGISFDALAAEMAKSGVALRAVGLDADESAALIGTLAQSGADVPTVMAGLTRSLKSAADAGIPADQALTGLLDSIQNAPNSTAAAQIAMESLGSRAGPQFAQLVREGKLGYEDLLGSIQAGGDTINGVAADNASFAESFQLLKNNIMLALEAPAAEVFGALGDAVTQLTPVISELAGFFGEALSGIVQRFTPLLDKVLPILEDLGAILLDVGGQVLDALVPALGSMLDAVAPLLPVLGELVGTVLSAVAPVLATLIEAIAPVVAILVEALEPVIADLQPVFDQLSVVLIDFIEQGLVPMLPALMELSTAFLPLLPPLTEMVVLLVSALLPILAPLIAKLAELAALMAGALSLSVEWIAEKLSGFNDWLQKLVGKPDELRAKFKLGLEKIQGFIGDLVGFAIDKWQWFHDLPGTMWDIAAGAGRNLANGVIQGINAIIGAWNSLDFTMPSFEAFGRTIGGFTVGVPDIPTIPFIAAESGALLTAPTLVLGGETAKARAGGGEIVSPVAAVRGAMRAELAAAGGGGGVHFHFHGVVPADKRQAARYMDEAFAEFRRSGGRLVGVGAPA